MTGKPDDVPASPAVSDLERRLRESESRYRTVLANAPLAFFLIDRHGIFTLVEGQGLEKAGVEAAAVIGRSAFELFGTVPVWEETGRVTTISDTLRRVLAGESVKAVTLLAGRYFENSFIPTRDESGAITGQVGISLDITKRHQADLERRKIAHHFRAMIEHGSDIISLHDADGVMRYQSPSVEAILGYDPEALIGQPVLDFIHPDDRQQTADRIEAIRRRPGRHPPFETRFRHKEERWCWFECTGTNLLADPALERIVFNAHDITLRKEAEEALRRTEREFRTLIENISDIITVVAPDGTIVFESPSVAHVLGYSAGERVGRKAFDFVHPDDLPEVRAVFRRGTTSARREFRIRHGDGSWRTMEAVGRLIDETTGEPRAVVTARDITERRSLEEQLRQAQKLESIALLAGGIAHDFNNMLTVINGYSDLILDGLAPSNPLRADVEEIRKAGQKAATLTAQLLAFSRKQILQPASLNLNDVVTDVSRLLQRLIGDNVVLTTRLKNGLQLVRADPGQLAQVIMNLTVNARDAMPDGGTLTIETDNVMIDEQYARIHPIPAGPYVLLSVSDTGVGIDAATLPRVFEPFFTTKEVGKGTGMGLATVYGIVRQTGGDVSVVSESGRGSEFRIYLPSAGEGVPTPEAEAPTAMPPCGTESILLVEDEEQVRRFTKQILEGCGYTVLEAANGQAAIDLCANGCAVDLVITDVVMPQVSGRELVDRLSPNHPDLRVLFMSGYTDDEIVHHGVLDEGIPFVQKPFTARALATIVRSILDSPRR